MKTGFSAARSHDLYRRIAIKVLYMSVLTAGESAWAVDNIPKPTLRVVRPSIRDAKFVTPSTKTMSAPCIEASSAGRPVLCGDMALVWTEDNLNKWLTNPQALFPGAKIFHKVDDPKGRADIIEFLKERAK